jgi:hypothetical protein
MPEKPVIVLGDPHAIGIKRAAVDVATAVLAVPTEQYSHPEQAALSRLAIYVGMLSSVVLDLQVIVASIVPREDPIAMRTEDLQLRITRMHDALDEMRAALAAAQTEHDPASA